MMTARASGILYNVAGRIDLGFSSRVPPIDSSAVVCGKLRARACTAADDFLGSADFDDSLGVVLFSRLDQVELPTLHAARKVSTGHASGVSR